MDFLKYFSLLEYSQPLKLAVNILFWFYILATLYYVFQFFIKPQGRKFYLGFFSFLSAFAITTPYFFVTEIALPPPLDLAKTRLFLESVFLICLFVELSAAIFIYKHLTKKNAEYLSSFIHFIIVFLGTIGFAVIFTAMFDKYFDVQKGFSLNIIILSAITMASLMILWELTEFFVDRFLLGKKFMSPSSRDTFLDLFFGFLGIILALITIISNQNLIFKFLI